MTILMTSGISGSVAPALSSGMPRAIALPAAAAPASADPVTPAQAPAQAASEQVNVSSPQLDQIQHAVDRLKESMKPALVNNLEFQIDKSTGKVVVMIFDAQTHTLVRQIPSQEVMAIAEAIDRMQGRGGLVKQKA